MTRSGGKILVVDDDRGIRRMLKAGLEGGGWRVVEAATGAEGVAQAASQQPDVIILDLVLPDRGGQEVLRSVREWSSVPVLVLSVRAGQDDKVALLDAGANDYLTKPFGMPELMARLRVLDRQSSAGPDQVLKSGPLKIDFTARIVSLRGKELKLTGTEYNFLKLLASNAGKVVTQAQILKEVWGPEVTDIQYLRTYATMLRKKLKEDPYEPRWIITEPGVGYRFKA
jgi:two-component system KDP operon response regulator KdpE